MKTPRELLLARHRAVESRLDARRQRVVRTLSPSAAPAGVVPGGPAISSGWVVFGAFVRQIRWHLAGMAAVWMVVAILNTLDRPSTLRSALAGKRGSAPRELLATLRENRRQVSELLGLPAPEANIPQPAAPSPTQVPSRRGELRETRTFVVA
jgi:hypothetical protein